MGSKAEAPPPRDIAQEGRDTLQTQIDLAPQQFGAESQFAPQYADLYAQITRNQAPQLQDLYGQLNTQQRTQDINDVATLGPQAMAAYRAANPQLASVQDAMTNRALTAQNPMSLLGPADQVTSTNNYATKALLDSTLGELAKGGSLSQSETMGIQNSTLNRFNQAGRANDASAIAGTALNQDSAQQARLGQRQQAVAGAAGLFNHDLDAQLQAAMANQSANFQTGAQNQAAQLGNAQYMDSLLGNTGQFLAQTQQDPFALVLGRSSAAQNSQTGNTGMFDPFSTYGSDLYNTNYNAQAAASNANANNSGALAGAGIGGGAMIGAAFIM